MSTVRIVLAYNQESFLAKRSESEWIERDPLFGAIRFKTFNKIVAREAQPIYSFLEEVTSQPAIDQTSGEEIGWAICVHIANFPATNEHIQQIFTTNNVQLDTDDSNHPQLLR